MLRIAGVVNLSFTLSADHETLFAYYGDLRRMSYHLPHITLLHSTPEQEFRLQYSTTEMGTYRVNIVCDVRMVKDPDNFRLRIEPARNLRAVSASATVNETTGPGAYVSTAVFTPAGKKTRVDYRIELYSELPRPTSMRLMPGRMVKKVTGGITSKRMREIAAGFIERSAAAMPAWLDDTHRTAVTPAPPKRFGGMLPNEAVT